VTTTVTTTASATTTSAATPACTGAQLSGTFKEAPGGGGAGQIEYVLTLKNTSSTTCWLAASAPTARLLSATGSPLPTKVTQGTVITQSTPPATLPSRTSATATVRFSPDVSGPGDSQSGRCQPKAYTLRVTATGGGTVDAPITPATSVCERGTLDFGVLAAR
jgi:hypothetical protein